MIMNDSQSIQHPPLFLFIGKIGHWTTNITNDPTKSFLPFACHHHPHFLYTDSPKRSMLSISIHRTTQVESGKSTMVHYFKKDYYYEIMCPFLSRILCSIPLWNSNSCRFPTIIVRVASILPNFLLIILTVKAH